MKRLFRPLAATLLLCCLAICQTAPNPPAFEAADVHVSAAGTTSSGGFLPNGRMEFQGTTLLRLISLAYSVPADRVAGGPAWLDTDRFDVTAKAPSAASDIAMRNMLQTLLTERFGLAVQREDKPVPILALVLAKPGVAKASSGEGDPDCKTGLEENVRVMTCHHMTMQGLAEQLRAVAGGYFNLPTVDRSGLKGTYDFTLRFMGRGQLPPGAEGAAFSLFTAIEKQLGVKVESGKEPMPVVSIERVNRTPTENAPGVTEKLGPRPTEFDVATIKPSRPGEESDGNFNNGRVDARAMTLRELIAFAWDVEEDWVHGGEKWLETDRFDITAKTAPTASLDTLRGMLQSLLADRFKLKVHKEPQSVTVYALTVGKSKLKDADPSSRSTCKGGLADGSRYFTCQNTSMAQFAEKIRASSTGYLDHPVVDLTGLKGAYDFTVTYTPRARMLGAIRTPAAPSGDTPSAVPVASDRPVGLTLFEAVDRQLGLKLATQKHPMPVVVIDHIDRTPTEN